MQLGDIQVFPKIVFQDHATHLPYLVGFRVPVIALQIESLGNAILPEYMVASRAQSRL